MLLLLSCTDGRQQVHVRFLNENVAFAASQVRRALATTDSTGKVLNPVTLNDDGTVYYCGYSDWRSGFFPGSLWYLYELTDDTLFLTQARRYTQSIEKAKDLTWHHDVGFMVGCSFGNGWRLTGDTTYSAVIVQAARSLATRFRPAAGTIQSWDVTRGWQLQRGWQCPVIVDNLMNLELLFEATRLSGDSAFYRIAVSHADRTLKEQFRPDGSCYHVVDYDPVTGEVRSKQTAQGYSDESVWSRGQAWAIYGYTVCYRETGNRAYLDQAIRTFEFMKNHPAMPADLIPYWDMSAPRIPHELRDVSTAACMASALYELCTLHIPQAEAYRAYADRIMASLASPAYRAVADSNGNFLLMHSVGSIPHGGEVDKPLNYADYYFIEALKRGRR
ncbi:MAG: glycoside hydrolase family 88 protein [Prevotellaceae bacterium]|nr:glycoside hydrolase family 88 protein [Prevotellaceae bacterium]